MPKAGQKRKKKEGRKMSGVTRYAGVLQPSDSNTRRTRNILDRLLSLPLAGSQHTPF